MKRLIPGAIAILCGALGLVASPALSAQRETLFPGGGWTIVNRVLVADFNHDGLDDHLSASPTLQGIAVSLAAADGTWATPAEYDAGYASQAAGDVNGDGQLDIVTVGDSELLTVLGDGHGFFGAPHLTRTEAAELFTKLSLADFDRDGRLDVLAISPFSPPQEDESVWVALGLGDGTFAQAREIQIGFQPDSVSVADVDSDGTQDIFAITWFSGHNQISVAFGHGDGTFAAPVDTALATTIPFDAVLTDLDGDGQLDAVISTWFFDAGIHLEFHRNLGGGLFAPNESFLLAEDRAPGGTFVTGAWPRVGDFDEDGIADVIVVMQTYGAPNRSGVWFLRRQGGFTFDAPVFQVTNLGGRPILTDHDHDGHIDLALDSPSTASGPAGLVYGRGDGSFREPVSVDAESPLGAVAAADLNADRLPDLVTAAGDALHVQLALGDGAFARAADVTGMPSVRHLELGDVTGDGLVDAVTSSDAAPGLFVMAGLGGGAFAAPLTVDAGVVTDFTLADLDGDGRLDAVTATPGKKVGVLLGQRDSFGPITLFPTLAENAAVATGDVNEDGVPDVCAAEPDARTVTVLQGAGNGLLAAPVTWPLAFRPRNLLVADVTSDGHVDIATVDYNIKADGTLAKPVLTILRGDGSGAFPQAHDEFLLDAAGDLVAADLDADGWQDLIPVPKVVSPFPDGAVTVLFGLPDSLEHDVQRYAIGGSPRALAVADFDRNGFADIAAAPSYDAGLRLFLNQSGPWASLSRALAAPTGVPLLAGSGIPFPDLAVSLAVFHLPRGAAGLLFIGLKTQFMPLAGGTLVPDNGLALSITAGTPLSGRWPKGLPPGMPVYFQAWFAGASAGLTAGQFAATNALVTLSR